MTGRVETADGKVYELPALLEWRLGRTGGVPCDSFRVKCLYSAEMGEALKAACRFAATENGVTRFRGVIDEWSAVCGAEGMLYFLVKVLVHHLRCNTKSCDSRYIVCSGTHAILLAAAENQRLHFCLAVDVQESNSFWSMDLM